MKQNTSWPHFDDIFRRGGYVILDVCLFVSLLATSRRNYSSDLYENFNIRHKKTRLSFGNHPLLRPHLRFFKNPSTL